jgi:hypothetical protein
MLRVLDEKEGQDGGAHVVIKRTGILFILVFVFAVLPACSGSCPSKETARTVLQPFLQRKFEIAGIRSLPQGLPLCEAVVTVDKQPPFVLYLDKKARYIVSGSIFEAASKKNITLERLQSLKK